LDKAAVLEFFLGGAGVEEEGRIEEREVESVRDDEKEKKDKDKVTSSSAQKDKARKPTKKRSSRDEEKSAPSSSKKKEKTPITHQQILDNLNIVVDKREKAQGQAATQDADGSAVDSEMVTDVATQDVVGDAVAISAQIDEPPKLMSQEEEERRAIQACLSAAGYEATEVSQEVLEKDRAEVNEKITSFEIPVGDSASILRCGTTATNTSSKRQAAPSSSSARNFVRVLELYADSLKERRSDKHDSKRSSGSHGEAPGSAKKPSRPVGKPIIIVPQAMTSPISLINSSEFFQKGHFIPRDIIVKSLIGQKPTSVTVKRAVSSRLGGGTIEYEIIDNPVRKLQSAKDWDRVVAVIPQGAAWQFKGWKMMRGRESNPVDVFSNSFGYYIGMEGAPVPKELQGWNVKKGSLSREKRGLDSVVYASFWNGLDEWMSVHKRDYLPA